MSSTLLRPPTNHAMPTQEYESAVAAATPRAIHDFARSPQHSAQHPRHGPMSYIGQSACPVCGRCRSVRHPPATTRSRLWQSLTIQPAQQHGRLSAFQERNLIGASGSLCLKLRTCSRGRGATSMCSPWAAIDSKGGQCGLEVGRERSDAFAGQVSTMPAEQAWVTQPQVANLSGREATPCPKRPPELPNRTREELASDTTGRCLPSAGGQAETMPSPHRICAMSWRYLRLSAATPPRPSRGEAPLICHRAEDVQRPPLRLAVLVQLFRQVHEAEPNRTSVR